MGRITPRIATSLNDLASLYERMGEYVKAEPLYQRALEIDRNVFGEENPKTAASLNNLAGLYLQKGEYAKAEPLLQKTLEIRKEKLGPDHPETASSFNNLAALYVHMDEYAKAEPLYEHALEIERKVLGEDHPETAICLDNLAFLKFDLGQIPESKALAQLHTDAYLKIFSKVLSFASEEQRLAYEDTIDPYCLFALLKGSETDLASALLRYKGVVLDSIIEDRLVAEASKESEDRDLVGRLLWDKEASGYSLVKLWEARAVRMGVRSQTSSEKWNESRANSLGTFLVLAAREVR